MGRAMNYLRQGFSRMPFRDIYSNQVLLTAVWATELKDARRSPRVAFLKRLLVELVLFN
jgi:hypothetical protein